MAEPRRYIKRHDPHHQIVEPASGPIRFSSINTLVGEGSRHTSVPTNYNTTVKSWSEWLKAYAHATGMVSGAPYKFSEFDHAQILTFDGESILSRTLIK